MRWNKWHAVLLLVGAVCIVPSRTAELCVRASGPLLLFIPTLHGTALPVSAVAASEQAAANDAAHRLAIFAPGNSFVVMTNEQQSVDVVNVLGPLGGIEIQDSGRKWKARFTATAALKAARPGEAIELRFEDGKDKARVRNRDIALGAIASVQGGRPFVPVASLPPVLAALLGTRINLHEKSHRLFIGEVGTRFTTEMKTTPLALVMTFTEPVNPAVSTEPGKVRMTFSHEPLLASAEHIALDDKTIIGVQYSEANGTAELTVASTAPLLASFSNGNKTITFAPAPPTTEAAAQQPPAPAPPPAVTPEAPATTPAAPTPAPAHARMLVLIDAAHGGEERGAQLSDKLAEKDVTLALARRLKAELNARGITAALLHEQDTTLTLDQRAQAANSARPWLYIALHAASSGTGIRVYTPLLPAPPGAPTGLVLWGRAQQNSWTASRSLGDALLARLQEKKIAASLAAAPLRPLNNVLAPALGIEVAPPATPGGVDQLASVPFQQQTAVALATALADAQRALEAANRARRGKGAS